MKRSTKFLLVCSLVAFVGVIGFGTKKKPPPPTSLQIYMRRNQELTEHVRNLQDMVSTCLKSEQRKAPEAGVEDQYGKGASKLVAIEKCGGLLQEENTSTEALKYTAQHPDQSKPLSYSEQQPDLSKPPVHHDPLDPKDKEVWERK
jgi:hypothetical protein